MSDQILWREWDDAAFEEARKLDRPILLNIVASWCAFCKELDATTLSDGQVAREVSQHFIPVRVDKDRRPDINERYNAGGWPTLAYLTPQGELIAADTFLGVKEFLSKLQKISKFYQENKNEIESKLRELLGEEDYAEKKETHGPLGEQVIQNVAQTILDQFDPVYGGFGEGQKFPHAESIDFALLYFTRTGDGRMRDVVTYTLDHMYSGEIRDRVEGGFFRYATKRDWQIPHHEKMLDSNASALRFFLEAHQVFGKPEYRQAAEGILAWLKKYLLDAETGAFYGSQDADPSYYALSLEDRARHGAPKVDKTIYTNWNALLVPSLFKAASVFEDESYRQQAVRIMTFLVEQLYVRGHGMYHYWDGSYHIEGLLTDQAYTIRALVDATQHTGENHYLGLAEELFEVVEKRQAAPEGGYFDIQRAPSARGGLKRQNRSILENAVMAEALLRLYYFTRKERYWSAAKGTLEAAAKDYKQYGYYVSGFARAVDILIHEPLITVIVGERSNPRTLELRRAALSRYVPTRIVHVIDPNQDSEILKTIKLPVHSKPTAYVSIGKVSYVETGDPRELPSIIEMADRDRIRD